MLDFLSLKMETFGLDISDLSFKVLKLKRKGKKIFLERFAKFDIESGLIEEGEIKNGEKLAKILEEKIKKLKLKTKYVVASLPEEKSFLQVLQFPLMSEEDLKSAIVFEIENYIPLSAEQVCLDFQIIPHVSNYQKKSDVLIAAVPKKIVYSYLSTLKKADLRPIAFEIESQAISRALIEKETTEFPVLIIDFGATRTSLIIFAGKSIRFTSTIPISSNHLTEILAKNLKIPFSEAEKLKINYGIEEKGEIFENLIPILVDLVQQVKKYLDYYESHVQVSELFQTQKKVKKIILCGGGAELKGLKEFLELELKTEVELGNPWINIFKKEEAKKIRIENPLAFTTAIGLALREIK